MLNVELEPLDGVTVMLKEVAFIYPILEVELNVIVTVPFVFTTVLLIDGVETTYDTEDVTAIELTYYKHLQY